MNALEKLRELTDKLPPLEAVVKDLRGNFVEYDVPGGFCVGSNLHYENDVAVQINYTSGGVTFPEHTHSGVEFIIIFRGEADFYAEGSVKRVGVGECVTIPPGTPHKWEFLTDTKLIAITVPASRGYPNEPG